MPRGRRRNKRIVLIFLAIFLIILLTATGTFGPFSSVLHKIATPVWKAGNFFRDKASNLSYFFRSKKNLLAENELLKERLKEHEVQILFQNIFFDENQKLKGILGRSEELEQEKEQFILGVILAKPNRSPYDTLIIDLGKNSGIEKGDYVFGQGNILIGRVEEVFSSTSKINLFSTPGTKLDVIISDSDIYSTLVGRGGGNFEMTLPRDVPIKEGTEVVLPGITPYLIATVGKINYDPRDPLQEILLTSPVNFQHLKFVQIGVKPEATN